LGFILLSSFGYKSGLPENVIAFYAIRQEPEITHTENIFGCESLDLLDFVP